MEESGVKTDKHRDDGHGQLKVCKSEEHQEEEATNINKLPVGVQQEIEDLYYFVPEVASHFSVLDKIGEGTFSCVYLARLKHHKEVKDRFALKHLIPTSHPSRIMAELRCLLFFGGQANVMGVELCMKHRDHIVIIMRYFPHHKFPEYFNTLDVSEVQDYLRNLLIALRHIHREDIIHRDIKPNNFLHNTVTKTYALVDFGLAQDAPVKLHKANVGRPPLVKGYSRSESQKENDKERDQAVESTQENIASSENKTSARTPLSPEKPSQSNDPPGTAGRQDEDGGSKCLSPRSQKHNTVEKLLVPPASVPGSKGWHREGKTQCGETAQGDVAQAAKCTSQSPRRTVLQKSVTVTNKDDKKKRLNRQGREASPSKSSHQQTCDCHGRPTVCGICLRRPPEVAQRAGTPGFRAPEVLMKHPHQSTAVDMWSAGVIFLSLLSGRYPFFRGNDDMTCLSQIISLLGTEKVARAAASFDKLLTSRPVTLPLDLKTLCQKLRASKESSDSKLVANPTKQWPEMPEAAINLLKQLLDPNPTTRITAEKALTHEFLSPSPESRTTASAAE